MYVLQAAGFYAMEHLLFPEGHLPSAPEGGQSCPDCSVRGFGAALVLVCAPDSQCGVALPRLNTSLTVHGATLQAGETAGG